MTTEEFSVLPLEARRFIEANAGCLACGSRERKLTEAYNLYLTSKKMSAIQIIGGGVNFVQGDKKGVLYPIREDDSPVEIREKIKIAKLIYETNPELFLKFNEDEIEKILAALPEETVVNLDAPKKDTPAKPATETVKKVETPEEIAEKKRLAAEKGKATKAAKIEATKKANEALAAKAAAEEAEKNKAQSLTFRI